MFHASQYVWYKLSHKLPSFGYATYYKGITPEKQFTELPTLGALLMKAYDGQTICSREF